MIYEKGKTQLPADIEKKLLAELEKYSLVRHRTVYWERLDEGREGEDTYEDLYSLVDTKNSPFDISIIIRDNDYSFVGIQVGHKATDSWNAGLNREEKHLICTLFADGLKTGSYSSRSTYDSPNNYDDVKISYSLRKF
ncbi:MAG: hypothetical protein IKB34_01645 [Clostridia bacterium]|nr:hypothetical protein [Clostridia bacterium]